jgi:tRNA (guanine37-N1)-methyltransferase
LRVSEIDGHAFIQAAPELAWTKPFAPYAPKPNTRQNDKAARKERERRKAESLPPAPPTPAPTEPTGPLKPRLPEHYIMNLPDSALTFLSSFPSSFTPLLSNESFKATYPSLEDVPMPLIHVYCFTREMEYETAEKDVLQVSLPYITQGIADNIAS